jgi:hypothetical protein
MPEVREHDYTTTSHSGNQWRIPRRIPGTGKYERERETSGNVSTSGNFNIISTPITIVNLSLQILNIIFRSDKNTGHTQKNGAVLIVFTITTAPFFCVCPV